MSATQLLAEEHQIFLRALGVLEVLAHRAAQGAEVPAQGGGRWSELRCVEDAFDASLKHFGGAEKVTEKRRGAAGP